MTSQRTRDRMVARLADQGIRDARVLATMAAEPRHLFLATIHGWERVWPWPMGSAVSS